MHACQGEMVKVSFPSLLVLKASNGSDGWVIGGLCTSIFSEPM